MEGVVRRPVEEGQWLAVSSVCCVCCLSCCGVWRDFARFAEIDSRRSPLHAFSGSDAAGEWSRCSVAHATRWLWKYWPSSFAVSGTGSTACQTLYHLFTIDRKHFRSGHGSIWAKRDCHRKRIHAHLPAMLPAMTMRKRTRALGE